MARSYIDVNREGLQRLRILEARLTDCDLSTVLDSGWTVSALLAHLAFWDRKYVKDIEEWERTGVRLSAPGEADRINNAMLPQWLAVPPREAMREVLAAAEAVDQKVESLSPELVETILAKAPRIIFRALHRGEHLDEIEQALV